MIGLIQRVKSASVTVAENVTGAIGPGLLIFLGVEKGDTEQHAERLAERIIHYRVFSDENARMNLNLRQIDGKLLVVSQFTLVAETHKGSRPGFSNGATPEEAKRLYHEFIQCCRQKNILTETGKFGADMQVSLVNDGPVTFWLQV